MDNILQEALAKGVELHKAGQLDLAKELYASVIQLEPRHPDANHNIGVIEMDTGNISAAVPLLKIALEETPENAQYWISYIDALIRHEAIDEARNTLALARARGAEGEVFDDLDQTLNELDSNVSDTTVDKGLSHPVHKVSENQNPPQNQLQPIIKLYNEGQLQQTLDAISKLQQQFPNSATLYNIIGAANAGLGKSDSAIEAFNNALAIKPDNAQTFYNIGKALQGQGKLDEAIEAYKKALSLKPDYPEAFYNMGNALRDQGKLERATEVYKQAISLKPDYAEAFNNSGIALQEQGKLEDALEAYNRAIFLKPNYAEAYYNLGKAHQDLVNPKKAIKAFNKALSLKPNFAEAYNNMGIAFQEQGKLEDAIYAYSKALSLQPNYHPARAQKLYQQACICDWGSIQNDKNFIPELGTLEIDNIHIPPFSLLAIDDCPERHRLRSELYVKAKFPQKSLPLLHPRSEKSKRLRIGYFSADFKNHPVMYHLIGILEAHNLGLFEIYAYSFGTKCNDEMRQRTIRAVDVFQDVRAMSDLDIALLARQDEIDIAVDLSGHTKNSRTGIFAYRAAPVQINYIGYPGTMGASFIDYIITDQVLLPIDNQQFFSEKPIYMPYSTTPLDTSIPMSLVTPSRSELGLPEDGFVFCAINNTYKLNAEDFEIWMRLLKKIQGSVLWLLEANKWCRANLVKEAAKRGVKSDRLVFQQKMVTDIASQSKYLSQFRQADLYLDTSTYSAASTAGNAIWAGLPVLTKIGKSYTSRMSARYLQPMALCDLITTSYEEYEELALELSSNPMQLALLKETLADSLISSPLCNNVSYTSHLEDGFQQAYQRYSDGKGPKTIFVSDAIK